MLDPKELEASLVERLEAGAKDAERLCLQREGWRLVNPNGKQYAALLRQAARALKATRVEASPAPVSELSGQDLQLLDRLKRDNVWDGSRPVLEGPRTAPETEQAFRLSERGYIALEQVARGIRLHITRKGVFALTDALAAKGGQ